MLLQGLADMMRCWRAIKTGVWMPRLDDVKETEDLLAEADLDEISDTIKK